MIHEFTVLIGDVELMRRGKLIGMFCVLSYARIVIVLAVPPLKLILLFSKDNWIIA